MQSVLSPAIPSSNWSSTSPTLPQTLPIETRRRRMILFEIFGIEEAAPKPKNVKVLNFQIKSLHNHCLMCLIPKFAQYSAKLTPKISEAAVLTAGSWMDCR